MKNIEFIQTCLTNTPLLEHYENARTRKAGIKTKRAIIKSGYFTKFDLFIDYHVTVELMRYLKQTYAIVTHSQINHIFLMS